MEILLHMPRSKIISGNTVGGHCNAFQFSLAILFCNRHRAGAQLGMRRCQSSLLEKHFARDSYEDFGIFQYHKAAGHLLQELVCA